MPINKLEIGKAFEVRIKNPTKYNTGNFIKSNNKSLALCRFKIAISSKFLVKKKLTASHAAAVKIPPLKVSMHIRRLFLFVYF